MRKVIIKIIQVNVIIRIIKENRDKCRDILSYNIFWLNVKEIKINVKELLRQEELNEKNRETVQHLVRANREVISRKTVPLFYFNVAKETKSEKSFWRFASQ